MKSNTGTKEKEKEKTIYIPLKDTVKDILNNYDAEELLNTIPRNYFEDHFLPPTSIIEQKIKLPIDTNTPVLLSQSTCNWLKDIVTTTNQSISLSLLFNYLIENVANCGKIHTKNIKQALDCYYYAAAHDSSLLSQILNEYADSEFYNDEQRVIRRGCCIFPNNYRKWTGNSKCL